METATPRPVRPVTVLAVIALFAAVLLIVMVVLCWPYFGQETLPEETAAQTTAAPTTEETTVETTTAPTEPETTVETEPTLPPPEENPYGPNDFQYNRDNYLSCTAGESINGIDVSSYQGEIDWEAVKASGIDFAIIRGAMRGYESGKLVEDTFARANLEGAIAAGLEVGVYIFSQATSPEEAAEEAAFLLDIIKDYEITMPVVYDWEQVHVDTARTAEVDAETLTACALEFCRIVEEAEYTPMVYFNRYQALHLMDLAQLKQYDFWLAAYTDRMNYPYKVKMWQYTDSGKVDGIQGPVDVNVWFLEN